jgi:hypothetical protein
MRNKKSYILLFFICVCVVFLSRCIDKTGKNGDPRGKAFAGSIQCRQCHQSIYDLYINSAHFKTTQLTSPRNVMGNFKPGSNAFLYSNIEKVIMEKRDSSLFQVLYVNGKEKETHRFDITFGIKHAQTFLYWKGNKTYELPVSYYASASAWAASPGFTSGHANFNRVVGKECFECHSSYIETNINVAATGVEKTANKNSLLTGIDCERCHGPATNHVNFHLAYPDIKTAKYIVTSNTLSRQQKLDACAVCHSGNDVTKEVSTFNFRPGDTLSNFFSPWANHDNKNVDVDVHGKQYQALAASKCFIGSKTITCSTCHSPHTDASSNIVTYSQKCISCHQNIKHPNSAIEGTGINNISQNCIDCHMPNIASNAITFQLSGVSQKSSYLLRTHKIAVYAKNALAKKSFVDFFNKRKN